MSVTSTSPAPFVGAPFQEANDPRALIYFPDYGIVIPDSYNLTLAIHGASDTATVVVPNKGAPDWTQVLRRDTSLGNANDPVYIQIYAGFKKGTQDPTLSNLKLRFWGVVDQFEIDWGPPNDWTTFTCRSLAAPLIDTKVVVPFTQNFTTVEFVAYAAKTAGMPAPVTHLIAPPATMQQVLAQELLAGVHSFSLWEMLVRAALTDDCDVWVTPTGVIHYEARTRTTRLKTPMLLGRDINVPVQFTHSPQFSKNVQVDIKIYNPQTKTATISRALLSPDGSSMNLISGTRTVTSEKIFGTLTTVTHSISQPYASMGGTNIPSMATTTVSTAAPGGGTFNASAGEGKVAGDSGKEKYVLWLKGGITQQQALAQARQMFLEISQHEYSARFRVPITEKLIETFDINNNIQLQGVPYRFFNGEYWPRELTEIYSVTGGFDWDVHAINHAPPQGVGA